MFTSVIARTLSRLRIIIAVFGQGNGCLVMEGPIYYVSKIHHCGRTLAS
jgi:hypothetical protein